MRLQGKIVYQDIGPGKYELVHPMLTYNLALSHTLKTQLDELRATHTELECFVEGTLLGDVFVVGGTNRQTLLVEAISL